MVSHERICSNEHQHGHVVSENSGDSGDSIPKIPKIPKIELKDTMQFKETSPEVDNRMHSLAQGNALTLQWK